MTAERRSPACVDAADVEGHRAPVPHARTLKHLLAPWTVGSANLWLGLSIVDVGSSSNPHRHSNEEAFYVVSGEGELICGEVDVFPLRPATAALVPGNTVHQLKNTGDVPLQVVCCASPPFELTMFEVAHKLASGEAQSGEDD